MEHVEVTLGQLPRLRAIPRGHQPEVGSADNMSRLVVTEVEPGEATRHRRPSFGPFLPDHESVIARLGHQRKAPPVGASTHARHAALQMCEPPRLAAVEWQDPRLSDRIVVAHRRTHEGDAGAIRRDVG